MQKPKVQISLEPKGQKRAREIQLLVNIVVPDPSFQPWHLSDEATIFDIYNQNRRIIESRLRGYFGKTFSLDLAQPLWSIVDRIKELYPGWPDEWDCVDRGEGPEIVRMK